MSDDNNKKKPITVIIDPACLEQLEKDMTPEQLQKFLDDIKRQAEDGTFLQQSQEIDIDQLAIDEPDVYQQLVESLDKFDGKDFKRKVH